MSENVLIDELTSLLADAAYAGVEVDAAFSSIILPDRLTGKGRFRVTLANRNTTLIMFDSEDCYVFFHKDVKVGCWTAQQVAEIVLDLLPLHRHRRLTLHEFRSLALSYTGGNSVTTNGRVAKR